MATKPAEDFRPETLENSDENLDRAIDDLRGVLKKDAEGSAPDLDQFNTEDDTMGNASQAKTSEADFGADFGADTLDQFGPADDQAEAAGFGGDFGSDFDDEPAAALFGPESGGAPARDVGSMIPDADASAQDQDKRPANLDLIMDIPIDMQVVLGSSRMPVSGLMNLSEGSLIGLDRKIGDPVEIMVNGRLFGRGEITVLDGDETRFGIKMIEVMNDTKK